MDIIKALVNIVTNKYERKTIKSYDWGDTVEVWFEQEFEYGPLPFSMEFA